MFHEPGPVSSENRIRAGSAEKLEARHDRLQWLWSSNYCLRRYAGGSNRAGGLNQKFLFSATSSTFCAAVCQPSNAEATAQRLVESLHKRQAELERKRQITALPPVLTPRDPNAIKTLSKADDAYCSSFPACAHCQARRRRVVLRQWKPVRPLRRAIPDPNCQAAKRPR